MKVFIKGQLHERYGNIVWSCLQDSIYIINESNILWDSIWDSNYLCLHILRKTRGIKRQTLLVGFGPLNLNVTEHIIF